MTNLSGSNKTGTNSLVMLVVGLAAGLLLAWGLYYFFGKKEATTPIATAPVAVQTAPGPVAVQPAQSSSPPLVMIGQNQPATPVVVTKPETHKQPCLNVCGTAPVAVKSEAKKQSRHAAQTTGKAPVKSFPAAYAPSAHPIPLSNASRGGPGDTFETIKGGDRECVVYLNGARMYSQFVWGDPVTTKQACDVFAAGKYSQHMHGASPSSQQIAAIQVAPAVATASATATVSSSVSAPMVTQVASASNFCVRAGKKYECGNNVVVIRPGGQIQCLPPEQAKESGDQMCTGIQ